MYEKAIEELIRRFPAEALPLPAGLQLVCTQRRLPSGNLIDMCFEDRHGIHYVVELKRHRVTATTISQLSNYLHELERLEPGRRFVGVLAPGTMGAAQPRERFLTYWQKACPDAPALHHEIAADLTLYCLQSVPGATVGRRTMGSRDSYTVMVNTNGVILAAIDARRNWVKLDFLLPRELAQRCYSEHLLTIETDRRQGKWVQSNVPRKLTIKKAKDLLSRSFEFQFGVVVP